MKTRFSCLLVLLGIVLALCPGQVFAEDNAGYLPDDSVAAAINSGGLVFITSPQSISAGAASGPITIQVQGPSGSPVLSVADIEVSLTSTSSRGRFDISAAGSFDGTITKVKIYHGSNQVSFFYRDTLAGTVVITATNPMYDKGTLLEVIKPAGATQILVESTVSGTGSVVPAQEIMAGSSLTVYALARDQYANLIGNIAGEWSLSQKTGKVSESDLVPSADGKSAVFSGRGIGNARIRVTSPGITSIDSGSLRVLPGSAADFLVSQSTDKFTSGVPGNFSVTVRDFGGNTVTDYTGTVHFTGTDSQTVLPEDYSFVPGDNGSHQFTATLNTLGPQSISVSDIVQTSVIGSLVNIGVIDNTNIPLATIAGINQEAVLTDDPAQNPPEVAASGISDQTQSENALQAADKPSAPLFWMVFYILGTAVLLAVIFLVQNKSKNQNQVTK